MMTTVPQRYSCGRCELLTATGRCSTRGIRRCSDLANPLNRVLVKLSPPPESGVGQALSTAESGDDQLLDASNEPV